MKVKLADRRYFLKRIFALPVFSWRRSRMIRDFCIVKALDRSSGDAVESIYPQRVMSANPEFNDIPSSESAVPEVLKVFPS